MNNQTNQAFPLLFLLFITLILTHYTNTQFPYPRFAKAGKVHIPDDLDDIIDDEEDDDWKNWGKKKSTPQSDLNPSDFDKMDPSQIQAEMMKRQTGPIYGFVKLRFGVQRTPVSVSETAMMWTFLLRSGGLEVRFMGMDLNTIMFTTDTSQDMDELKEFIFEQPDAYEVKIGDNIYRRPGDPPLEEVIEALHRENKGNGPTPDEHEEHAKEEL